MSKSWDDLAIQQPIVTKMLTNSLRKNRLAHAYLFEGERGTGKKEFALFLAKSLLCKDKQDWSPCHECVNCRRVESGNHPDVHIVEPDGLSIKKYQIGELQEEFSKTGVESKQKFYLINYADKMTPNASNSLLKFLEEPYPYTTAILLTEQSNKMLDTILSRCQTLTFQAKPKNILLAELEERGVASIYARLAVQLTNSLDHALALCQDTWFAESRKVVLQLSEVLKSKHGLLYIQEKWIPHFKDREQVERGLELLLVYYRDILSINIGEVDSVVFSDHLDSLNQCALQLSQQRIIQNMNAILEAKKRLSANVQSQLLMEQLVLKLQEGS